VEGGGKGEPSQHNMSMLFNESKGTGVAPEGGYEVRLGEEGSDEQTTVALGTKLTHTVPSYKIHPLPNHRNNYHSSS